VSGFLDKEGLPVELAAGRGDLRYRSTWFEQTIREGPRTVQRIGKSPVSFSHLFATQPWVAAAVMRMMTWAVRVPMKCYRRKDGGETREQVKPEDHPLARMLQRPWLGPMSNRSRLIQVLLGPLLVHGNSVNEVEVIGGEEYFKALDWRALTPIGTESGQEIEGWRYDEQNNGEWRDVGVDRALHCAWWSPLGPLGVSPLEQLGVTIRVEDAANRYQQAMFGNSARPPSAVTSDTEFLTLERDERTALMNQLRADVEELYAGPENAGKPAVLPPGLDWKPIGHTSTEAQLIEQRKVAREEVAAVYQIPPPMMGILDNATYSNIETQKDMIYSDALGPPLAMIEQMLTSTLARDYFGESDLYVEFDFGPVLRGDRAKEIATFRDAIASGIQTMNEARRALNLQPSDEPDADRLFYPANNLKPVGDAEAEAQKEAEAAAQPNVPAQPVPPAGNTAGTFAWIPQEDGTWVVFDESKVNRDKKGRLSRINAPGAPSLPGDSIDNPIDCGSDVDKAAQLLGEGKHVKLSQPREVSTLLDKLGDIAKDAKAKGADAPTYDLCKVSVPGTNLFCAETKGVPRAEMPQLSGVPTPGSKADKLAKNDKGEVNLGPEFVKHLEAKGISVNLENEQAAKLKASQNQLNGAKVAGMMGYLAGGNELPGAEEGIFVSDEGYVIDGHHRWAAKVGVDALDGTLGDVEMPVRRIDADIITLLNEANAFAEEWGIPQAGVAQMAPGAKAFELGDQIGVRVLDGHEIPVFRMKADGDCGCGG
jgi:HK97 family phage portal protein